MRPTAIARRAPPKRRRLSAEQARLLILETAAKELERGGPEAVRVQAIARAVGVTDAAVHHHFGSRQGLLEALLKHAGRRLKSEVRAATASFTSEAIDLARIGALFASWYDRRGYARLAMWLSLSGWRAQGRGMLAELVEALHRARVAHARAHGRQPPSLEHSRFLAALFHGFTLAEPLFGKAMRQSVGFGDDDVSAARFRVWAIGAFEVLFDATEPAAPRRRRARPLRGRRRRA